MRFCISLYYLASASFSAKLTQIRRDSSPPTSESYPFDSAMLLGVARAAGTRLRLAAQRSAAPLAAKRHMHLSPRELDHMRITQAGLVAQRRLALDADLVL